MHTYTTCFYQADVQNDQKFVSSRPSYPTMVDCLINPSTMRSASSSRQVQTYRPRWRVILRLFYCLTFISYTLLLFLMPVLALSVVHLVFAKYCHPEPLVVGPVPGLGWLPPWSWMDCFWLYPVLNLVGAFIDPHAIMLLAHYHHPWFLVISFIDAGYLPYQAWQYIPCWAQPISAAVQSSLSTVINHHINQYEYSETVLDQYQSVFSQYNHYQPG